MQTDRKVIAAMTVITSLAFYWFAKAKGKQETPYVMIGGFLGSILGEAIAENIRKNNPQTYYNDDTDH